MYTDVTIADRVARERRKDLLREAEQERLLRKAHRLAQPVGQGLAPTLALIGKLFVRSVSL
jgi:hypothetical protein